MMASLVEVLGLGPPQQERLGNLLGRIKGVARFLEDSLPKAHTLGVIKAIEESLPWAGALATALSEAAPPVKFVVTLFEKLTEINDPAALAYLACTLAYQRSIEQAVQALDLPAPPTRKVARALETAGGEGSEAGALPFRLDGFSYSNALQHPFVRQSDGFLAGFAAALGYSEDQQRRLVIEVHARFVTHLKTILCSRDSAPKFTPLRERMAIGTEDALAYEALAEHADYQRWLFEERRVFGKEPFTLAQVYVETDCGLLTWEEIQGDAQLGGGAATAGVMPKPTRLDPFQERNGGRRALAETVLELLASKDLEDPVVIQGVAGSGKSAFTLWLCAELVRQGLRPIRLQLRDLELDRDRPVTEAISRAVRLTDPAERPIVTTISRPEHLFLDGQIFNQGIRFGTIEICPYVLILDGWDEISISAAEGYAQRVDRLLENLRSEYLQRRDLRPIPVRVVLTGRPSAEVAQSGVLRGRTPVLTLRPLRPEALEELIAKTAAAVSRAAAGTAEIDWNTFEVGNFRPVLERYQEDFERWTTPARHTPTPTPGGSGLDVLGLPLLAQLAIRLLAEEGAGMEALLASPTALYRSLIDLTCAKAGKYERDSEAVDGRFGIVGVQLRELLRYTAAAISNYGEESISYEELRLRLKEFGIEMSERVERDTSKRPLTQLVVAFFFKGGHPDLGCEFLHKSFREYLFAEAVVEALKGYGRVAPDDLPERPVYWQDFQPGDPRYDWIRRLAPLLAPHWFSREVAAHLREIIEWEIRGDALRPDPKERPQIARLNLNGWERVRDGLADLWDWWGEGVHLRPQPSRNRKDQVELAPPYALDLVEWSMRLAEGPRLPLPWRQTTIDAHLGDALCRLAALVHFQLAAEGGWVQEGEGGSKSSRPFDLWNVVDAGEDHRRYQTVVRSKEGVFRLFAPGRISSSHEQEYFANYADRINSAGWRPGGRFPLGCALFGIDLRGSLLELPPPIVSSRIQLSFSNLSRAKMVGFAETGDLRFIDGVGAEFYGVVLMDADLQGADLTGATFFFAQLLSCNLREACLDDAIFQGGSLEDGIGSGATFLGAYLRDLYITVAGTNGFDFKGSSTPPERIYYRPRPEV